VWIVFHNALLILSVVIPPTFLPILLFTSFVLGSGICRRVGDPFIFTSDLGDLSALIRVIVRHVLPSMGEEIAGVTYYDRTGSCIGRAATRITEVGLTVPKRSKDFRRHRRTQDGHDTLDSGR